MKHFFIFFISICFLYATEFKTKTLISGLEQPWSFNFISPTRVLVTQKNGLLQHINLNTKTITTISNTPEVYSNGQGSLFDVVLHPNFKQNKTLFLSYSASTSILKNSTVLMQAELKDFTLKNKKILYSAAPSFFNSYHYGGRLLIKDKHLYLSIGDRHNRELAQDLSTDMGKVLRFRLDGSIPTDNPFYAHKQAKKAIFTYGHRNPQGLALHPFTKVIYASEHGPQGGDEINELVAGANYGWPVISYGEEYGGGKIGVGTHQKGMKQPLYYYTPSIATSNLAIYLKGDIKSLENSVLVGALKARHMNQIELSSLKESRHLFDLQERIRDVKVGPKKGLYVLTQGGEIQKILGE